MRTGIGGQSLHGQQALGRPPCNGTAYAFANRRRTRLKLLCRDGTGVWMCLRRLHRGLSIWPQADEASWQMSAQAMAVAGSRCGLAAPVGACAGAVAPVRT